MQDIIDEAINFLKEYEPPEGYFVGFSGGKDSIVTLELCRMAGVKHKAYYSFTGIDAPEVVRFIRKQYPTIVFLHPKMSFWDGIRKKSPPLRVMRWCCDVLKKNPSKHIPLKHRVMGLRAEESKRRASYPRVDHIKKQIIYKPIFNWMEWHVWQFIEDCHLPYPSLYDEGFDRLGCVICPFIMSGSARLERHKKRWPAMYKIFEKTVHEWFASYQSDPTAQRHATPKEYLEWYYRGKM